MQAGFSLPRNPADEDVSPEEFPSEYYPEAQPQQQPALPPSVEQQDIASSPEPMPFQGQAPAQPETPSPVGPTFRSMAPASGFQIPEAPRPIQRPVEKATVKGGLKAFGLSLIPGYPEMLARQRQQEEINRKAEDQFNLAEYQRQMQTLAPLLTHDYTESLKERTADQREKTLRQRFPNQPEEWYAMMRYGMRPTTAAAGDKSMYLGKLADGSQVYMRRSPNGGFVDEQTGRQLSGVTDVFKVGTEPKPQTEHMTESPALVDGQPSFIRKHPLSGEIEALDPKTRQWHPQANHAIAPIPPPPTAPTILPVPTGQGGVDYFRVPKAGGPAQPVLGPDGKPLSGDKTLAMTPEQKLKHEQEIVALDSALEVFVGIRRSLPLLKSMVSAGKIKLATSPETGKLIVSRLAQLTDAEAKLAAQIQQAPEHSNVLRGPLGATAFRSREAQDALWALAGARAFADPRVTAHVLDQTIKTVRALRATKAAALAGGKQDVQPDALKPNQYIHEGWLFEKDAKGFGHPVRKVQQ